MVSSFLAAVIADYLLLDMFPPRAIAPAETVGLRAGLRDRGLRILSIEARPVVRIEIEGSPLIVIEIEVEPL